MGGKSTHPDRAGVSHDCGKVRTDLIQSGRDLPAVRFLIDDKPFTPDESWIRTAREVLEKMQFPAEANAVQEIAARMAIQNQCGPEAAGLQLVVTDELVKAPREWVQHGRMLLLLRFESSTRLGHLWMVLAHGVPTFRIGPMGELISNEEKLHEQFRLNYFLAFPRDLDKIRERLHLIGGELVDQTLNPDQIIRTAEEALRKFDHIWQTLQKNPGDLLGEWSAVETVAFEIQELWELLEKKKGILEAKADSIQRTELYHVSEGIKNAATQVLKITQWKEEAVLDAIRAMGLGPQTPAIWPMMNRPERVNISGIEMIRMPGGWLLPQYVAILPLGDNVIRELVGKTIAVAYLLADSHQIIQRRWKSRQPGRGS
ncbi:hypothetical protein [Thermoflexus sp.]|uniref:hypothetical protein n=1 Tax=Thermoflexus sp. TaxID=1969742 RepID=UPI002ADE7C7E|nr:hypothetical protein [Thermoflexus sp.]